MSEAIAAVAAPLPAAPAAPAEVSIESLTALIPDAVPAPSVGDSTAIPGAERGDAGTVPVPPPQGEPAAEEEPPVAEAPAEDSALDRAEAAAKRAREGSRRYREMLAEQERQSAEVRRQAAEAQRLRHEAEQNRRLREDLKKDPYAALKNLGMTDQELAERALREGTPEAALYKIQEELQAERQARTALEQRLQAEREATMARQAEAKFASVADNETAYPRLSELSQSAQLAVARAALQQIANNGHEVSGLSDEQVAEACEIFLTPKKSKAAAAKPAPAPAAKPGAKPAATKTLTNAVATERSVAPRPWHELTEDEQIAQIAASIPD